MRALSRSWASAVPNARPGGPPEKVRNSTHPIVAERAMTYDRNTPPIIDTDMSTVTITLEVMADMEESVYGS